MYYTYCINSLSQLFEQDGMGFDSRSLPGTYSAANFLKFSRDFAQRAFQINKKNVVYFSGKIHRDY